MQQNTQQMQQGRPPATRIQQTGSQIDNLLNNDDVNVKEQLGGFYVIEWKRDLSVSYGDAINAFFASKMNVHRRQILVDLANANGAVHLQAGAMQAMFGPVEATSNVKGVGDLFSKAVRGAVTGESAIKPEYRGSGYLLLEPTFKHLILLDAYHEFPNGVVLDDGLYLASWSTIQQRAIARSNVSSALAGNEGLFNLMCSGSGVIALESPVPREELITVDLNNDTLKIDGNMALAWSAGLQFTVERSTKSLLGSAASGEGLVNVYRGTGRVLMAPVDTHAPAFASA